MRVALIGCGKGKKSSPCKAREMYTGPLFTATLRYCLNQSFDRIYILSAKYGLLELDTPIKPYDLSLHDFYPEDKSRWRNDLIQSLMASGVDLQKDEILIFAGREYAKGLPGSKPLEGLSIGKRLQWFKRQKEPPGLLD